MSEHVDVFEVRGVRANPARRPPLSILAIGLDPHDSHILADISTAAGWKLHSARTYREAMRTFCYECVSAIVCRSSLPDGDWKDVVSQIAPMTEPPPLIVIAPAASDLRQEVHALGGYGILMQPLDGRSLIRLIAGASHEWRRRLPGSVTFSRIWPARKVAAAAGGSYLSTHSVAS